MGQGAPAGRGVFYLRLYVRERMGNAGFLTKTTN